MPKNKSWTEKDLTEAVKQSNGYRSTLKMLGLSPSGGNYTQIKKYIKQYNLDTSHWNGQAWNRGQKFPTKITTVETKLKKDTDWNTNQLRKQLLSSKIFNHVCAMCKLTTWNNQTIPLELDHINGDRRDNRLINLRLLCPNCHAQTPTYRGKNKRL